MSTLQKIRIQPAGKGEAAILLQIDGQEIKILHSEMKDLDTHQKLHDVIAAKAADADVDLPLIFIHKNRNGTYAIANGAPPEVWPEDRKKEDK